MTGSSVLSHRYHANVAFIILSECYPALAECRHELFNHLRVASKFNSNTWSPPH